MLVLDFISPSPAAAADLTSGLSSASAFSAIPWALASSGINPKTRIAVTRAIVLSAVQASPRICHASAFRLSRALGAAVDCCPDSLACGCPVGGCTVVGRTGSLLGGGFGFVGCSWAGAFVCGADAGVVDCCCANSKLDARSTKAEHPGM